MWGLTLLKAKSEVTTPPKCTQKYGAINGTPWDAQDQRICCHFARQPIIGVK